MSIAISKRLLLVTLLAGLLAGGPVRSASAQQAEETVYADRSSTFVREGPASYHRAVVVANRGTPLRLIGAQEGWVEVRLPDDRTGWVSTQSVAQSREEARGDARTSGASDAAESLAESWADTSASTSGIAAAVRGFQTDVGDTEAGHIDSLVAQMRASVISKSEVAEFHRAFGGTHAAEAVAQVPADTLSSLGLSSPYNPSKRERQVGLGVASRIAAGGMVKDAQLREYVNLIAQRLIMDTPFYDWDFEVMILDQSGPDAFACPGGIIFITRGAMAQAENEAQIAGMIAHEIGHVVLHHGLEEMKQRKAKIESEKAFAQLDQELEEAGYDEEDRFEETEKRMEKFMEQAYRRLVDDRLLSYERQADRFGAILMAEAGYNPTGLVQMSRTVAELREKYPEEFRHEYLEKAHRMTRVRSILDFVQSIFGEDVVGAFLPERLEKYQELIDA